MKEIFCMVLFWNIITFALYGIDKWKSKHDRWRIKESVLIWSAFIMGGIGAMFGMRAFRHKTKHMKFKVLVPLAVVFNVAIAVMCFLYFEYGAV